MTPTRSHSRLASVLSSLLVAQQRCRYFATARTGGSADMSPSFGTLASYPIAAPDASAVMAAAVAACPIGPKWQTGSWTDTSWACGTWAASTVFTEPTTWDVLVTVKADPGTVVVPADVQTILVPADQAEVDVP